MSTCHSLRMGSDASTLIAKESPDVAISHIVRRFIGDYSLPMSAQREMSWIG